MKVQGYDIRRAMGIAVMDSEKGPMYHWVMSLRPFRVRTTTLMNFFDGTGYKTDTTLQEFVQLLEKPTTNIIYEGVKSRHREKRQRTWLRSKRR